MYTCSGKFGIGHSVPLGAEALNAIFTGRKPGTERSEPVVPVVDREGTAHALKLASVRVTILKLVRL